MEIRLENIYVSIQFQGHRAKLKVAAAINGSAQVCAPLGLVNFASAIAVAASAVLGIAELASLLITLSFSVVSVLVYLTKLTQT